MQTFAMADLNDQLWSADDGVMRHWKWQRYESSAANLSACSWPLSAYPRFLNFALITAPPTRS